MPRAKTSKVLRLRYEATLVSPVEKFQEGAAKYAKSNKFNVNRFLKLLPPTP
jgi:hypothetical protein